MTKTGREEVKVKSRSRASVGKIFWQTILMMAWVFAAIVFAQLLVGLLMILVVGSERFVQPVFTAIYSALSYILALVLIILVPVKLFKKWKTRRKDLGLSGSPTWTDIGLSPVGFIVGTLLGAGLAALFSVFPWFDAGEAQNTGFNIYMSGGDRVIAFLTLVVLAPIAEEIIFRGWLYGKMRENFSECFSDKIGMIISILLTSILFGMIHLQWNVGVNVFALSVVLCGLREITGTIYAGILTHMIKNGVAFYLVYVLGVV